METLRVGRSSGEAEASPDPSWRGLYRAGGVSAMLFVVLVLISIVGVVVAPPPLNRSYAALGALIGIVSWSLTLALPTTGGGAPVLVYLSDRYMAATTAAQHTAFATAAEVFIAENNTTGAVGIMTPVGILILSLVMLKGIFPKGVAYLGILTGALGIVSEALRPIIGIGYIVYGLLLPIWFIAVGWKLSRLGLSSSESRSAKKL